MRYIWQHIRNITDSYDGSLPLSHFLKNYFKKHPKLGSRDRKLLSEMAYCYYRASKSLSQVEGEAFEERVKACLFLCGTQQKIIADLLEEEWDFDAKISIEGRWEMLADRGIELKIEKLFTGRTELSKGIERHDWLISMLQKPRLFIRIIKNKDRILSLLKENGIEYETINEKCLSLAIGAAIDKLLPEDSYVVQDASSQETGKYFQPKKNEMWYDCCSGAGGKSLLLKAIEPTVKLTVSDTRESILQNLKARFKQYELDLQGLYNIDVTKKEQLEQRLAGKQFDGIICDVPCSGSGTWSRTPEQLYFFDPKALTQFARQQKNIATNVSAYLKPGGKLIYITCSVFKEENEDVVNELIAKTGLQLESMQIINGIEKQADTMFAAVLKK